MLTHFGAKRVTALGVTSLRSEPACGCLLDSALPGHPADLQGGVLGEPSGVREGRKQRFRLHRFPGPKRQRHWLQFPIFHPGLGGRKEDLNPPSCSRHHLRHDTRGTVFLRVTGSAGSAPSTLGLTSPQHPRKMHAQLYSGRPHLQPPAPAPPHQAPCPGSCGLGGRVGGVVLLEWGCFWGKKWSEVSVRGGCQGARKRGGLGDGRTRCKGKGRAEGMGHGARHEGLGTMPG